MAILQSMKRIAWFRKNHKWLALIAGFQILIWSVSGLYMSFVNLDIIHGDHLVDESKLTQTKLIDANVLVPISPALLRELSPTSVTFTNHFGRPFYQMDYDKESVIVDGLTGDKAQDIPKNQIRHIADQIYAGNAAISQIELLATYPSELWGKKEPIWRVSYHDLLDSTLYFHFQTGQLVSKRTDLWRTFDFLWQLHIIEYLGFEGYQGLLFRILSLVSLVMALFGFILLFYRLKPEQKQ
jgi:uncharacterized iron-regulated membrane protein